MELEFVVRAIILVAVFVIPAFIVSAPSVLLERRWNKTRLIGLYILMGMISYIILRSQVWNTWCNNRR